MKKWKGYDSFERSMIQGIDQFNHNPSLRAKLSMPQPKASVIRPRKEVDLAEPEETKPKPKPKQKRSQFWSKPKVQKLVAKIKRAKGGPLRGFQHNLKQKVEAYNKKNPEKPEVIPPELLESEDQE